MSRIIIDQVGNDKSRLIRMNRQHGISFTECFLPLHHQMYFVQMAAYLQTICNSVILDPVTEALFHSNAMAKTSFDSLPYSARIFGHGNNSTFNSAHFTAAFTNTFVNAVVSTLESYNTSLTIYPYFLASAANTFEFQTTVKMNSLNVHTGIKCCSLCIEYNSLDSKFINNIIQEYSALSESASVLYLLLDGYNDRNLTQAELPRLRLLFDLIKKLVRHFSRLIVGRVSSYSFPLLGISPKVSLTTGLAWRNSYNASNYDAGGGAPADRRYTVFQNLYQALPLQALGHANHYQASKQSIADPGRGNILYNSTADFDRDECSLQSVAHVSRYESLLQGINTIAGVRNVIAGEMDRALTEQSKLPMNIQLLCDSNSISTYRDLYRSEYSI